jgi:hypothetical protein
MGKIQDIASYTELLANLRTYVNSIKSTLNQYGKEIDGLKSQDLVFVEVLGQMKQRVQDIDTRSEVEALRLQNATLESELRALRETQSRQDQSVLIAALDKQNAVLYGEVSNLRDRLNSMELRSSMAAGSALIVPKQARKLTSRAAPPSAERDA